MKPILPEEVQAKFNEKQIDPAMIDCANELLVKNWDGQAATINQKELVALYMKRVDRRYKSRQKLYDNNGVDIEDSFRRSGWSVEYDKPAYCETYDAYFTFRKNK